MLQNIFLLDPRSVLYLLRFHAGYCVCCSFTLSADLKQDAKDLSVTCRTGNYS